MRVGESLVGARIPAFFSTGKGVGKKAKKDTGELELNKVVCPSFPLRGVLFGGKNHLRYRGNLRSHLAQSEF